MHRAIVDWRALLIARRQDADVGGVESIEFLEYAHGREEVGLRIDW